MRPAALLPLLLLPLGAHAANGPPCGPMAGGGCKVTVLAGASGYPAAQHFGLLQYSGTTGDPAPWAVFEAEGAEARVGFAQTRESTPFYELRLGPGGVQLLRTGGVVATGAPVRLPDTFWLSVSAAGVVRMGRGAVVGQGWTLQWTDPTPARTLAFLTVSAGAGGATYLLAESGRLQCDPAGSFQPLHAFGGSQPSCGCKDGFAPPLCNRCQQGYSGYPDGCSIFLPGLGGQVGNGEFCWRATMTRPAHQATSCPVGYGPVGSYACARQCPSGYELSGGSCLRTCPKTFHNDPLHCGKPASYARGAGYPWKFGDSLDDSSMFKRCQKDHKQGCEKSGLVVYPKCRAGFHPVGCCVCSPDCPDGMTDIGVSCTKNTKPLDHKDPLCGTGEVGSGSSCRKPCAPGWSQDPVFPATCWAECQGKRSALCMAQGATGCADSQATCNQLLQQQATAIGMLVLNVVSLGSGGTAKVAFRDQLKQMLRESLLRKGVRGVSDQALDSGVHAVIDATVKRSGISEALLTFASGMDPTGIWDLISAFLFPICDAPPAHVQASLAVDSGGLAASGAGGGAPPGAAASPAPVEAVETVAQDRSEPEAQAPEPVSAVEAAPQPPMPVGTCAAAVTSIPANRAGGAPWTATDVLRLCGAATDLRAPARCFEQVLDLPPAPDGSRFAPEAALALCAGSRDGGRTVACYQRLLRETKGDSAKAIEGCRAQEAAHP